MQIYRVKNVTNLNVYEYLKMVQFLKIGSSDDLCHPKIMENDQL